MHLISIRCFNVLHLCIKLQQHVVIFKIINCIYVIYVMHNLVVILFLIILLSSRGSSHVIISTRQWPWPVTFSFFLLLYSWRAMTPETWTALNMLDSMVLLFSAWSLNCTKQSIFVHFHIKCSFLRGRDFSLQYLFVILLTMQVSQQCVLPP